MSTRELQQLVAKPLTRELRALLAHDTSQEDNIEEAAWETVSCHGRRLCRAKLIPGVVFGALALMVVARSALSYARHADERFAGGAEVQLESVDLEDEDCHTAEVGEQCHSDVRWAMQKREDHPEWYIGLNNCSEFEDFQAFMHTQVLNSGARRCPKPCPVKKKKKTSCKLKKDKLDCHNAVAGEECYAHMLNTKHESIKFPEWYPGLVADSSLRDVQYYLHKENVCPIPCINLTLKKRDNLTGCHTALPGDTCYADILLAKGKFIKKHPEWYPGLSNVSGNDEFQAFLNLQKHIDSDAAKKACPIPCNKSAVDAAKLRATCKTADVYDKCYESVLWGATTGIRNHPDWYAGLTAGSTFEEFQHRIHGDNNTACTHLPCPCQRPVKGDACYSTIEWVLTEGIKSSPDDYSDISEDSTIQQVQDFLHRQRTSPCGRPCKTFDEDVHSPWRSSLL